MHRTPAYLASLPFVGFDRGEPNALHRWAVKALTFPKVRDTWSAAHDYGQAAAVDFIEAAARDFHDDDGRRRLEICQLVREAAQSVNAPGAASTAAFGVLSVIADLASAAADANPALLQSLRPDRDIPTPRVTLIREAFRPKK